MVTEDQREVSLIPSGGSAVSVLLPNKSDLESLETTVEAASVPSWATNTQFEPLTSAEILERLFRSYQLRVKLNVYKDISTVLDYGHEYTETQLYILLWLRAASQVLHDHQGQTAIPIIINNLTIDSDGLASV